MAKASPIQNSFNAGEFSPLMYARVDFDKYPNGLELSQNGVGMVHGPWQKRSGTRFVAEVKDSTKNTRLVEFEFSDIQAYILEFGDEYIRFFMDRAQILDGMGDPYEIASPYPDTELAELQFVQSADVLFIFHPGYAPRKLSRKDHTDWTLEAIEWVDGPYLDVNTTGTTFAVTGTTLTASATEGINGGEGFLASDVGRLFRIWDGSAWVWGKIDSVTSTTEVEVTLKRGTAPISAADEWRLGAWSDTTGYPVCGTFFEDRLWVAGGVEYPQRVDGSRVARYEDMSPTDPDGTLAVDHAVGRSLNATKVNAVRWLLDDEKGLLLGTLGGEWIIRASVAGEAITPVNIKAVRAETNGSAYVQPVRVGKAAVYVQRATKKVREMAYVFEVDGFRSPDITIYAEHITGDGVVALAHQQEPQSILWALRKDGVLLACGYDRAQDVVGWHRQILGGYSTADRTARAVVESIAVVPTPDGLSEDLWLVVRRHIAGQTKRYIEYLEEWWTKGRDQADAFFVDCGLTYAGPAATTISGLDHLEGETVTILADGAVHPDKVVEAGAVTLDREAAKVHVGLRFEADARTLRLEAGAADGTSQGKTKRIHRVVFRLEETLGFKAGTDEDHLETLPWRTTKDPMGSPPALFSGDKEMGWPGGYDTRAQIYWRHDLPTPCTVLAVMPQVVTQDR